MQFLKGDIQERILKVAEEVFLEKGYKDASMREIASRAGVTVSNIYHYFTNKDEIFRTKFAFLWGLPNVELKPGIDIVLEAVGLTNELKDADVVVTGEGCLDFQTAMGKVPVGVAKTAKNYNCKVIAFAGSVTEEAKNCNEKGIDAFFSILPGVCSLDEAMDTETAQKNMRNAAEQVFRLILTLLKEKCYE